MCVTSQETLWQATSTRPERGEVAVMLATDFSQQQVAESIVLSLELLADS